MQNILQSLISWIDKQSDVSALLSLPKMQRVNTTDILLIPHTSSICRHRAVGMLHKHGQDFKLSKLALSSSFCCRFHISVCLHHFHDYGCNVYMCGGHHRKTSGSELASFYLLRSTRIFQSLQLLHLVGAQVETIDNHRCLAKSAPVVPAPQNRAYNLYIIKP